MIFFNLLQVRYNCGNFHHCRICVTDFRERGPFCTSPHPGAAPKKPILNRINASGSCFSFFRDNLTNSKWKIYWKCWITSKMKEIWWKFFGSANEDLVFSKGFKPFNSKKLSFINILTNLSYFCFKFSHTFQWWCPFTSSIPFIGDY